MIFYSVQFIRTDADFRTQLYISHQKFADLCPTQQSLLTFHTYKKIKLTPTFLSF